ncbi:amidohydrolase family protein [Sediminitomix flava]|nr:amidohydrolase family protein [Sediminitomix flava]
MRRGILLLGLMFVSFFASAQITHPVNGVVDNREGAYAFTHATIVINENQTLTDASLIIKEGKIIDVGTDLEIPSDAIVTNLEGKFIYPSFIDLHTDYGMPEIKKGGINWNAPEQIQTKTPGAYNANESIKAEFQAKDAFRTNKKALKEFHDNGFGTVLSFRFDGVARGTSALVLLSDENENLAIIKPTVAAHFAFDKGSSSQLYPVSIMGYAALLRQTYYDASWYATDGYKEFRDLSLEAMNDHQVLPQIFSAHTLDNTLLADKIGDEFGIQYIIKGSGKEYQKIDQLVNTQASLIVPIDFPAPYNVSDPLEALNVSLAQLKDWELAPSNLAMLEQSGISFAITSEGLKNKKDFLKNLRIAVENGLSKQAALKALTSYPAKLIGASREVGQLKSGMYANFVITSGDLFEKETKIFENWVGGKKFEVEKIPSFDYSGKYNLALAENTWGLSISEEKGKSKVQVMLNDSTKLESKGELEKGLISLTFKTDTAKSSTDAFKLSGWKTTEGFKGKAQNEEGDWLTWTAVAKKVEDSEKKSEEKKENTAKEEKLGDVIHPFIAYGNDIVPEKEVILFKNATVWTSEAEGILVNTDVLVKDGKIIEVGQNLSSNKAKIIDATGKHLTAGIIDEHSHIALNGINDVDKMSSMVRMEDAIDASSIQMYRQLAGGVTAAQLLHGSANPVGGQSALIKFRWGKTAQELLIEDADQFIKFALGENVKRGNWSSSQRYPLTRMGVEQVYRDGFTRAIAYQKEWDAYNELSKKQKSRTTAPRKDLQLEALVEILNSERFISCHSYVQSEINMLMKLAEEFGFRVNTFTHILEGYKVADKMSKHGAGASTFADWWAYKFEVYDAIPHNAALMAEQGVVTAINSDDAEMGRRLNQEAAKSVKYAGMSEEEAWKMVTLNPAKLLHLDDKMGSIKEGKDADLVLWDENPLSVYAKALYTLVDGTIYYDRAKDKLKKDEIKAEKARIMKKMKGAIEQGAKPQLALPMMQHLWHCDDLHFNHSGNHAHSHAH